MEVKFDHLGQLPGVARELLAAFPNDYFFAFFGSMGVGKTTLIKELCAELGVEDNVCSPTFAIINEYCDRKGNPVYHFDFYRLEKLSEVYDLGYEEYFFGGDYCFTEWTEKVEPLLPDHYVRVEITEEAGVRTLVANRI